MSLRPVGNLPTSVYWRRRMLVLIPLLFLVILTCYVACSPSGSGGNAGASSPVASTSSIGSSPTPSASPRPTTSASATTSAGSSAAARTPVATPTAPAAATVAACVATSLQVAAVTSAKSYKVGTEPVVSLQVTNTGMKLACLTEALTLAVELGIHEPGRRYEVDVALVETQLARGDLDAAASALDELDEFIRPRGRRSLMAVVDRLDGTLTALRGEPDQAVTRLASAAVRAAARPFRLDHARTVLALAEVHALRDDLRATSDALDSARRLYVDMGYAAGVDLVDRRKAALGTEDTALTPSERAVVEAVVAGATARQAGVDLSISHRTVEAHLRSVYRKLGVRGRVELTALALRGGLDLH